MKSLTKFFIAITIMALAACTTTKEVSPAMTTPEDAARFANEVYIYGYPLVLMGVTRDVGTAVAYTTKRKAPINQFNHMRSFPDETFTDVVTPNADTLYSSAWLDLSKEPMVLTLPSSNRYYLTPILSAWTEVIAAPGSRTSGNERKEFVIVGPSWTGKLPANLEVVRSPTNNAWILGRVQTNGKNDYVNVHTIQDGMELTPLSFYGKTYIPPSNVAVNGDVDVTIPPSAQVDKMDARSFYARLAEEMKMNPPTSADAAMVVKMKAIGLSPGESFAYSKLSDEQKRAVDAGFYTGFEKLHSAVPSNAKMENGWINNPTIGTYKTDYDSRAFIALVGLGANIRDDAVYFKARTDAIGARLNGNNKYVLRFAKGQTPPVNGFWSLSLYDEKNFFAKNSLKRYAIGDRDRLTYNSDGSLTLYIQAQSPGKAKESNWLPAPSENFSLVMRTYWPKQAILDGTWKIPSVQRTEMPPSRLSKK